MTVTIECEFYIQQFYQKKSMSDKKYSPESLMMSYGYNPELSEGAIKCPIFQTSTFVFRNAQEGKAFFEIAYGKRAIRASEEMGLIYSRINNPNLEIVEKRLTLWDGAADAAVFESGMSAVSTVLMEFLKPGDIVLYSTPLYGGSHHFLNHVLSKFGIRAIGFDASDADKNIEDLLRDEDVRRKVALIYLETPANPTNTLVDIKYCADVAETLSTAEKKIIVAVDNTYLGPIWQHPLQLGADLVIYSATKYLGGHSDLTAGAVLGNSDHIQRLKVMRTFLGNMCSPNTAWLLLRSLETLKVRMDQQQANAVQVAEFLDRHERVEKVHYLGLIDRSESSKQYQIYKDQCLGSGAMVSFHIKGGEQEAFAFLNGLRLIKLAVSLGGTESLAEHPATMTHTDIPDEEKLRIGITEQLIRISIGIENAKDIIADLDRALWMINGD
ncbi:cystathionine gamma-synthase family protein [Pedobacter deserti]|uniref:cystathionine gamma-synthase family protein n=1 Tax=Pedobacter deserti TaxID=2817382 RepID=UPI00210D1D19|nr:cystathionine gamma-synthase family protein [Pedobacter sp. SYSU D00382]